METVKGFQSTPPVWVVTGSRIIFRYCDTISIHTTRVGGDILTPLHFYVKPISIHTTRVGGDLFAEIYGLLKNTFQSTPPVWVVTYCQILNLEVCNKISIHTTRVGGDNYIVPCNNILNCISIHTTRVGGDPHCRYTHNSNLLFQSTPPVWVVTSRVAGWMQVHYNFNPHHPCGWWHSIPLL